jgi:hydroxymethylpyrimidine pyrophosphatase-like HAD family hydrolase
MKPAVRLIASDIDGTLIPPGGSASVRTLAALRAAQAAGMTVVLVTGRAPRTARLVAEAVGVDGPAICANGALVVDLPHLKVLRDVRIDGALAADLVRDLIAGVPGIVFAWERGLEWGRDPGWPQARWGAGFWVPGGIVGPVGPQAALGLSKLTCFVDGLDPDEAVRQIRRVLGDRAEVFTATSPPLAEITAMGQDKREALEWLCSRMLVARDEVLAIGDAPNDLPMLLWAGRGVAMGNSHASVLAAVSERTHSHQEDGFAAVIEEVLSLPGR